jgi:sulfite exporter TauE/SafE
MYVIAAISLGFLGSFHCVGMCGPIALAIPVNRTSVFSVISGSIVYNGGRILTYAVIGLLAGLIGQGFAFAGMQNILSISMGILILAFLLIPGMSRIGLGKSFILRFVERLKSKFRTLFGIYTTRALFFIGLMNGLLPCGLVYMGLTGSVATGNAINGALFMAGFGLGTFPAMLSVTLLGDRISVSFREKIRKAVPVFIGIMAVMLILRGMNLGIPYLSPSIEKANGIIYHECCHK